MLHLPECSEDLGMGLACVTVKRTPVLRTEKRDFPISILGPAMTLSPSKEMLSWLIRSRLSPQAHLPASRIGIYTDFA